MAGNLHPLSFVDSLVPAPPVPSGSRPAKWLLRALLYRPRTRRALILVAVAVVPMIAYVDYLAKDESTFAAFYIWPVLVVAWLAGRRAGIAMSVFACVADVITDWAIPQVERWPLYVGHMGSRFIVYFVGALLAAATSETLRERMALVAELERALVEVRRLEGLLPICAWCKRIREGSEASGDWKPIEQYMAQHSQATFTHGICPDCTRRLAEEGRGQFSEDIRAP